MEARRITHSKAGKKGARCHFPIKQDDVLEEIWKENAYIEA